MPTDLAAARLSARTIAVAVMALAYLCGSALEAYAQMCKPRRPRPQIVLTTLGPCEFNPETLSFAGEPAEQAKCLMRAADRTRNLGPPLDAIPETLARRVGQPTGLPDRSALAAHLVELNLAWDYAPFLWLPVSRARDNDPQAPQARYFVIHDTSAPFIGGQPFPADIDENRSINNLARYMCRDDWAFAHVIINRMGAMLLSRELSEPWRATKFERATRFGTDLRGLFLHVELVQPRGRAPGRGGRNDARAPDPGFSARQYERLALVYVIASVRAGRWLIPAFHVAIDASIRGGHDDPQNFEIAAFATNVERLVQRLRQDDPVAVAAVPDDAANAGAGAPVAPMNGNGAALENRSETGSANGTANAPVLRTSGSEAPVAVTAVPVAALPEPPAPVVPVVAIPEASASTVTEAAPPRGSAPAPTSAAVEPTAIPLPRPRRVDATPRWPIPSATASKKTWRQAHIRTYRRTSSYRHARSYNHARSYRHASSYRQTAAYRQGRSYRYGISYRNAHSYRYTRPQAARRVRISRR